MKKVLFASTALVMTAGVAAAEIAVTGGANMGIKYDGATDSTTVDNEIDFNIVGSGETDSGVSFGASVDLDADASNETFTTGGGASDPEVFVAYNGLKLTVGGVDGATDRGGLGDPGYDGIGIDNVAEVVSHGSHNVRVDYAFGDIAVAASVGSDSDDWAIGATASFDAFTVHVGAGEAGGLDQMNLTLGYSAGAFGVKAYIGDNDSTQGYGVEASYTTGDVTLMGVYADSDTASEAAFGVGVAYDLGGATLAGGVGSVAGETVADLGISFSF
ncbi:MAG: porin [Pseudomonadota bacterium]|nr:porin [Pseudomonadota bacterium]